MNKCELVNSRISELVNTCANEQLHKRSGYDPAPELRYTNHLFGVPMSIPGEQTYTYAPPTCTEEQLTHEQKMYNRSQVIIWPRFQGTSEHRFTGFVATAQKPSVQKVDKNALDKRAELEGVRIDTTEHLCSQYKTGYRLLYSTELRSSGLLNRGPEDQRPLYNYAVDNRLDELKVSTVRKFRKLEVDRHILARRIAGHRIIMNARSEVVDRSEPLNARELKRLSSVRRNRSLLNSGVRRFIKCKLVNWTADHYNPNDHV